MPRAPVTQATITRAVKAMAAAGVPIGRVEIAPDGTVIVIPAAAAPALPTTNDWD
jgi:hypothetical protein